MYRNIILAFDFAKRDIKERYFGTGLGQLWYILSPIVTIFIYTVIFSDFMKMKLNIIDSSYSYSIYLVPGILAWTSFSTTISRLSNSIFEKASLIKKLNVPVYTFQLSILFSEIMLAIIAFTLSIIFLLLVKQPITLSFLWLPVILLFQFIFAFGLGVIFSLFTPFFKDLKEIIPIIIQLWFWMTPIVYVKDMIAKKYPFLVEYNPIYKFIQIYQHIFLYGNINGFYKDIVYIVIFSLLSLVCAAYLYKKMISEIKDII